MSFLTGILITIIIFGGITLFRLCFVMKRKSGALMVQANGIEKRQPIKPAGQCHRLLPRAPR